MKMSKKIYFYVPIVFSIVFAHSVYSYTNSNSFVMSKIQNEFENKETSEKEFIDNVKSQIDKLDLQTDKYTDILKDIKSNNVEKNIDKEFAHEKFNLVVTNPYDYLPQYKENFDNLLRRKIIDELDAMWYKDWNNKTLFNIAKIEDWKPVYWPDKLDESDPILVYLKNYELNKIPMVYPKDIVKQKIFEEAYKVRFNKLVIPDASGFFMSQKLNYINWNFDVRYLINHWKFELTSFRERRNVDESYRLHNIKTAFSFIWNNKLITPWKEISFNNSINYDEKEWKNYKTWKAISNNEEVDSYGGWLCWAATAIYQWIFLNKWLQIMSVRNHSWWYGSLYNATINSDFINTPWLDATIWIPSTDLKFKNITNKPIIFWAVITTRNKKIYEQNFTISEVWNKGSYKFISKKDNCYTWEINWKNRTSCYKKIK